MRDEEEGDELTNNMFILACRYFLKGMAMFQQIKILCPNYMLLD